MDLGSTEVPEEVFKEYLTSLRESTFRYTSMKCCNSTELQRQVNGTRLLLNSQRVCCFAQW